jgi:hypothetical protein
MMRLSRDLEFHHPFENDHEFVGGVREVFPPLTWWIHPEFTIEAPGLPVRRDLVLINHAFFCAGVSDTRLARFTRFYAGLAKTAESGFHAVKRGVSQHFRDSREHVWTVL